VLTIAAGDVAGAPGATSLDTDRCVNEDGTFAAPERAVAAARSGAHR